MATMRVVARGLEILEKYVDPKQHLISAEHDQIWAGGDPSLCTEDDRKELESLDWFVDEKTDSWTHFV